MQIARSRQVAKMDVDVDFRKQGSPDLGWNRHTSIIPFHVICVAVPNAILPYCHFYAAYDLGIYGVVPYLGMSCHAAPIRRCSAAWRARQGLKRWRKLQSMLMRICLDSFGYFADLVRPYPLGTSNCCRISFGIRAVSIEEPRLITSPT